jgi:exopolyphosphatase/guanosine-5'-triphosphate,3'-diphosphate pyrophosphatase
VLGAARHSLSSLLHEFSKGAEGELSELAAVHELRIAAKQLRYGLEVFGAVLDSRARARLHPQLVDFQEHVGTLNDVHQMILRLQRCRDEVGVDTALAEGLHRLMDGMLHERDQLHAGFLDYWAVFRSSGFFEAFREVLGGSAVAPAVVAPVEPASPARPAPSPSAAPATELAGASADLPAPPAASERVRIAAIDVGTNSIRLIIAEVGPGGSYRILDDEKEITRLGRGLHETGDMHPSAIEHSVLTIERMKGIAEGYSVREIRLVGTCAVRDSASGPAFIELIRQRTGLVLKGISAEEEAMLSYRSAARAFDVHSMPAAVVDVGGGSTQIVLSAPSSAGAGGEAGRASDQGLTGVVERIFTLPLGAVRLTERFGGSERVAGEGFRELRQALKTEFKRRVSRPPFAPQILIGTGGTLTSLAAICAHADLGPAAEGLFSGTIQGYEVKLPRLRHVIENLRAMSLGERMEVPGLSADRADIIIAGLAIVERVMKRLGVNSLRVHEGGIRDGLILSMIEELGLGGAGSPAARRDPMRAVRRFARACGYEQAHCRQVTRLTLRLFDQFASSATGNHRDLCTDRNRMLVEAAASLHDVGYLINYSGHHKHSYHLIIHADLPGFTTREIEVIAHVARYHRLAEPSKSHRTFARLSKDDRRLVRFLSAILRVADGLDRTHSQRINDVALEVNAGIARLTVESETEPAVDIWGAQRKSGLFSRVLGLEPFFEWRAAAKSTAQPPRTLLMG